MKRIWLLLCLFLPSIIIPVIVPSAVALAATTYTFTSATQITGGGLTFTGGDGSFVLNQTCSLSLKTGGDGEVQTTVTVGSKITGTDGGYNGTIKSTTTAGAAGCPAAPAANGAITISDPNGYGPSGGNTGTSAGGGNTNTPTLTCNAGFNPLNWLICAGVKGMVDISNQLDSLINAELAVGTQNVADSNGKPTGIFGPCASGTTCGAPEYKTAWSSFRDIALGLLVVVGLIVVFSTALGLEILDAYTVRKVLPRIVIIAIAITLSWNLLDLFITFTNDLGYGIRYLIYKPFETLKLQFLINGFTGVAVDLIGGAAITAMGIFGLLLFAVTAVIAVASFFFLLIIRQILITGLIIFAPIALVAYILPNTQRFYSQWWNLLSKAALLGVIVEGIVAIARVGAAIADQNPSPVNQLAAFVAYFGGYFIAFSQGPKMAGAGVGAISGVASRMTQSTRNSISKKQSENTSKNIKQARAGHRWNQEFGRFNNPFGASGRFMTNSENKDNRLARSRFGKGLQKHVGGFYSIGNLANRAAVNTFDIDEMSRWRAGQKGVPGFKRYSTLVNEQIADAGMHASIEGYQEVQKNNAQHYRAYQGMSGEGIRQFDVATQKKLDAAGFFDAKTQRWRAPKSLEDFETMGKIMAESEDDKIRLGGTQLEQNAGYWSTIKSNPGMEYADIQTIGLLGASVEGRADPDMIANVHNSMVDSGNGDLAARAVAQAQKVGQGKRPDIRMGHGLISERHTGYLRNAFADPASDTAQAAVVSITNGDWVGAKAESIDVQRNAIMVAAKYTGTDPVKAGRAYQIRAMVGTQSGPFGAADPDARRRWQSIKDELVNVHHLDIPFDQGGVNQPPPSAVGLQGGGAGGQSPGQAPQQSGPSFKPPGSS
jgi:hypothetical protein